MRAGRICYPDAEVPKVDDRAAISRLVSSGSDEGRIHGRSSSPTGAETPRNRCREFERGGRGRIDQDSLRGN